jgi:hypothetical protein
MYQGIIHVTSLNEEGEAFTLDRLKDVLDERLASYI